MLRYLDDPDKGSQSEQNPELQEDELTLAPLEEEAETVGLFKEEDESSDDGSPEGMFKEKIKGLEHRISYLERIVKVSQMLNSTLSLEPLLQIIIQSATELTNTESCSIM